MIEALLFIAMLLLISVELALLWTIWQLKEESIKLSIALSKTVQAMTTVAITVTPKEIEEEREPGFFLKIRRFFNWEQ